MGGQVGQSLSGGSFPHKGHFLARCENASSWSNEPSAVSSQVGLEGLWTYMMAGGVLQE